MNFQPDADAVAREYRYERLTWPEINTAVELNKVIVLPIGSVEQHGHHLPLDVDVRLASSVALEAGRRSPGHLLIMPPISYGYCHHVMDFPGTITIEPSTFVKMLIDITKSVAHHGFKRIILLNGHGSNYHLIDQAGRQTNLQTEAMCCTLSWWQLAADYWNAEVRESGPGGCAHACELETSAYMHLDLDAVRQEHIPTNDDLVTDVPGGEDWQWVDLTMGQGPASIVNWTSSVGETGAYGRPDLATEKKGRLVFDHAVTRLIDLASWLQRRPAVVRHDHRVFPPTADSHFEF